MRDYSPTLRFGFGGGLTPMVRNLIIANGVVWLMQLLAGPHFTNLFGLHPLAVQQKLAVWQLFTYMFLHAGFFHIFWNMFALWMFGGEVERYLGSLKFLQYYLLTGVAGGFIQLLVNWGSPGGIIGASGSIYGVLVAFGVLFPNRIITLLLFFILPVQMRAKTMVAIFIGISLVLGFQSEFFGAQDRVAHFAHLGGAFAGYFLLRGRALYAGLIRTIAQKQRERELHREKMRQERIRQKRKRIDEILDQINEVGYDNIPQEDKDFLKQASEFLAKEEQK